MNVTEHLSHLDDAGKRLGAAAAAAGPDAPVPSCPDWVVRDLVRHQGGVHRWATGYIAGPLTEYRDVDLDDIVGSWPSDADLVDWFAVGHASLIEALSRADPDLVCWTFLAAPSPLAMWARRQAHETTVHRVDAELAAGWQPAKVPAAFAADGVDELLACFITRPHGSLRADPAMTLRVRCTDDGGDWLVSIEPDQVTTSAGDDAKAAATAGLRGDDPPHPPRLRPFRASLRGDDPPHPPRLRPLRAGRHASVCGPAHDLYLALWHRLPVTSLGVESLSVEGDTNVFDFFNEQVRVTWS